jgi:hypothetical protein
VEGDDEGDFGVLGVRWFDVKVACLEKADKIVVKVRSENGRNSRRL